MTEVDWTALMERVVGLSALLDWSRIESGVRAFGSVNML